MSKKGKRDEVDLLEGFDFDSILAGEIKGPEAFVPSHKNKLASNLDQTSTKLAPQLAPQLASNLDQTSTKAASKVALENQTSTKLAPEPAPQLASNLYQTSTKVASKVALEALSGLQRNALIFIYESCRISGNKISPPIMIRNLSVAIRTSIAAARVAVQRLEAKEFVRRFAYKNGRSGWTKYELPEGVYSQLLFNESRTKVASNLDQTSTKAAPEPTSQPAPSLSSSSSSRDLYIKESTATQPERLDGLGALDLTQLREFGITHAVFKRAMQLHPNAPIEGLQELAFRLGELFKNPKERAKIQNARGFVIKLVEQLASGIAPLDHIETPTDRLMREYAELARRKRIEQKGYEDALLQDAFEKWDRETIENEKFQAVPIAKNAPAGQPRLAVLREYFREKVWPETRERILRGET